MKSSKGSGDAGSAVVTLLLVILVLMAPGGSSAAILTVGPGDCSSAAVNAALARAVTGDTVQIVCTGTVTWDSAITLSGGKTLRGPGRKSASGTAGTWPLLINVQYSAGNQALVHIVNADGQPLNRLTGLRFQGIGRPSWIIRVSGRGTGTTGHGAFRIDNNYFDQVSYGSRTTLTDGDTGKLTGVVDHNIFYYVYPEYGNNSYQSSYRGSSPTCFGYDSLSRDIGFGSSDFVFWEDNYFHDTVIETSDGGGRIVFRYNEVESTSTHNDFGVIDGHGADTAGHHCSGVVGGEFYRNSISSVTDAWYQLVYLRGGTWRVFNNTLPTVGSGVLLLNEYRAMGSPYCSSTYLDWNACSGRPCCTAAYSQCPTEADFASAYPLPNQIHDTIFWNNTRSGTNKAPTVLSVGYVTTYIAANRDYWVASSGLESALPSTCTAGTFYGATDSGRLWKCSSPNTWTLSYTPFTYPHPLQGGASYDPPPAPPMNLRTP